jgi:hypothetical protein
MLRTGGVQNQWFENPSWAADVPVCPSEVPHCFSGAKNNVTQDEKNIALLKECGTHAPTPEDGLWMEHPALQNHRMAQSHR